MLRPQRGKQMAYVEIGMWEVLEVLRRVHRGESQVAIERVTGRTRKTVRRYAALALELGWDPKGSEPDEELARAVTQRLRPVASEPQPGASESRLAPHGEQIRAWLQPADERRGLKLSRVHQLLARRGVDVPYSSLHRFAVAHCGFQERRRRTVRMAETAPGEAAEVDFGRLGLVWDPETQRRRVHHVLLVTLVHSRHQYLHVCTSQTLSDFIEGLEDAFVFFGGVPARVVLDNLKAAVTKADRYDPVFQRTFDEYARHRGFVIDAAVARHPKGKPKVERNVQYVRESFFRGETWIDRDHVQRELRRWCLEVAGQRIHGTTQRRPLAVFEDEERPKLRSLEAPRFDPPSWAECKAHPDHHVQFQKALYSVPTRYVGKRVTVRGDSKLVRIYVKGDGKPHERMKPGRRSTDYDDYPEELTPYARRDPEALIREGHRLGGHIGGFLEKLLAGDFPWAKLRQAQQLLRLSNKYGRKRVDAACRRALYFELFNTKRVQQIIEHELERTADSEAPRGQLVMLPPRFLRAADSFTHHSKEDPQSGDQPIARDRDEAPQALGTDGDPARPRGLREEDETP